MNIYDPDAELRLDERDLSGALRRLAHAAARGAGAARQRRPRAHHAAQGHLHRAQDQGRDPGHDHGLGGARKHGGAARHQRSRQTTASRHCTVTSTRSPATKWRARWANTPTPTSRSIRRSSSLAPSPLIARLTGRSVLPRARHPPAHHLRAGPRAPLDRRPQGNRRSPRSPRHRTRRTARARAHLRLRDHVERYVEIA